MKNLLIGLQAIENGYIASDKGVVTHNNTFARKYPDNAKPCYKVDAIDSILNMPQDVCDMFSADDLRFKIIEDVNYRVLLLGAFQHCTDNCYDLMHVDTKSDDVLIILNAPGTVMVSRRDIMYYNSRVRVIYMAGQFFVHKKDYDKLKGFLDLYLTIRPSGTFRIHNTNFSYAEIWNMAYVRTYAEGGTYCLNKPYHGLPALSVIIPLTGEKDALTLLIEFPEGETLHLTLKSPERNYISETICYKLASDYLGGFENSTTFSYGHLDNLLSIWGAGRGEECEYVNSKAMRYELPGHGKAILVQLAERDGMLLVCKIPSIPTMWIFSHFTNKELSICKNSQNAKNHLRNIIKQLESYDSEEPLVGLDKQLLSTVMDTIGNGDELADYDIVKKIVERTLRIVTCKAVTDEKKNLINYAKAYQELDK